jgi:hypothetical protein
MPRCSPQRSLGSGFSHWICPQSTREFTPSRIRASFFWCACGGIRTFSRINCSNCLSRSLKDDSSSVLIPRMPRISLTSLRSAVTCPFSRLKITSKVRRSGNPPFSEDRSLLLRQENPHSFLRATANAVVGRLAEPVVRLFRSHRLDLLGDFCHARRLAQRLHR